MLVQALYLQAGLEGWAVVLHVSEHQLLEEDMLEDISMLLSGTEIPRLLSPEDGSRIVAALQDTVTASGKPASKASVAVGPDLHRLTEGWTALHPTCHKVSTSLQGPCKQGPAHHAAPQTARGKSCQ